MIKKVAWIALFPVATFAIAGFLSSCVSLNGLVSQSNIETGKTRMFQLSGLSISQSQVAARDIVVITAEVTNITAADETYNAELKINNISEASDKVLVPAGKTQTLTFAIFKDKPGTYRVSLGQLASQFSVVESVAAVGPGSQVPALSGGAGCCSVGNQLSSPSVGQSGAGCCATGTQNKSAVPSQPRRTSGCGCCR
jgi:hypothetical protein